MKAKTVKELAKECEALIKAGHGDKEVLISADDEGNGYHSLFFGFCTNQEDINSIYEYGLFHDGNDPRNVVILG